MMPGRPLETGARLPGVAVSWVPDSSNDEWYTPPRIFEALGLTFDLDPATIPGGVPWVPARKHLSIEDDGLTSPWDGLVWLNPPYSEPQPWVARLAEHKQGGVALLPADTSTEWWHERVTTADAFCFIRGRVRFVKADLESRRGWTGRFPSVLCGWGRDAVESLNGCDLGWVIS